MEPFTASAQHNWSHNTYEKGDFFGASQLAARGARWHYTGTSLRKLPSESSISSVNRHHTPDIY